MSKINDFKLAIIAGIEALNGREDLGDAYGDALAAWGSITPVNYRQNDVLNTISAAVAKAGGTACLVSALTGDNVSDGLALAQVSTSFSVSIWSKPILVSGTVQAEDLLEAMIAGIHNLPLNGAGNPGAGSGRQYLLKFLRWRILPRPDFLVYDASFSATLQL